MPRYLFLLHGDESAEQLLSADEKRSIVEAHIALGRELSAAGKLVAAEALTRSSRTKVVRKTLVTDGPFAETKEVVGSFYLLECADDDEAVEWAKRIPASPSLAVEIRPVADV
jgi:hypothetical protein